MSGVKSLDKLIGAGAMRSAMHEAAYETARAAVKGEVDELRERLKKTETDLAMTEKRASEKETECRKALEEAAAERKRTETVQGKLEAALEAKSHAVVSLAAEKALREALLAQFTREKEVSKAMGEGLQKALELAKVPPVIIQQSVEPAAYQMDVVGRDPNDRMRRIILKPVKDA